MFEIRTADAETMANILRDALFTYLTEYLYLVPFGYETHIKQQQVRETLRFVRNETASYIKFAPDYFILDRTNPEKVYLLEFKSTRTPLWSSRRIDLLKREAKDPTLSAETIGQMELAAYENYKRLNSISVNVAVLNYCAYAHEKLVCDFIERIKVIHRDVVRLFTVKGSRTPFANIDIRSMRTLTQFLCEEHPKVDRHLVERYVTEASSKLLDALPSYHT